MNFNPDKTGKKCHYESQFIVTSGTIYIPVTDLPAITETSMRTTLSMDGSLSEFAAVGGEQAFVNSLSSELGIDLERFKI